MKHKPMDDWLRLINAETEADLQAIEQDTDIPEILDVIAQIRQLSADEAVQKEAREREAQLHLSFVTPDE